MDLHSSTSLLPVLWCIRSCFSRSLKNTLQADHIITHFLERKPDLIWPGSFVPEGLFFFYPEMIFICNAVSNILIVLFGFCSAFNPKAALPIAITSSAFHDALNLGHISLSKKVFLWNCFVSKKMWSCFHKYLYHVTPDKDWQEFLSLSLEQGNIILHELRGVTLPHSLTQIVWYLTKYLSKAFPFLGQGSSSGIACIEIHSSSLVM